MKNYLKNNYARIILKVIIIGAVIAFDMVTKAYFAKHTSTIPFINGFISFKYVENTGAAFGIFGSHTIVLTIVSIIFVIFFTVCDILNKEHNTWSDVGYACIIAGAIGNLVDRLFLGYVRDFINFDFMTWGVFNVADSFITIGCVCYIIYVVSYYVKQRQKKNEISSK